MPGIRRLARIDLDAFAAQVAGASVLDARADAYGHSLELIAPVARDAGVAQVLVSDERDAAVASAAGLTPIVGRLSRPGVGGLVGDGVVGPAAYGLIPGMRPVLTLTGEIIAAKRVGAGAGVSYGYSYRTAAPGYLALIGLGYADGVPRPASNRARVVIDGNVLPLVGRIAMDQFVVACGDIVPEPGGEVVVFGGETAAPPTLDWARWTGRSPLALTAGLGPRIHRIMGGTA